MTTKSGMLSWWPETIELAPSAEGLYYYDFTQSTKRQEELQHNTIIVVDTVENLTRNYMKRELDGADEARRLYVTIGRPSEEVFELLIQRRKLLSNPVKIKDFRNGLRIYGKDLGSVGKQKQCWNV
jgi:hypothetical protein